MENKDTLKIIQDTLAEVNNEIAFALNTDEGSEVVKTIQYNGKDYQIKLTREDLFEDTLIRISKKLEEINFGVY